ncbi:NAD-dependent protein deacetylase sirtuin-3, mitochondrial isoform X5 [Cuculus canorus]|uniref:NAD-dependent protein deacetylase sirtuin-3, mitochondrial isoform X5 n=1 Tax=Cuculus canorus TaxID=55661 RepID=UPI0023AB34B3|nr:NAD-dependent protein deacetylase sirtuin-3, mitochondrial isoform X5 [Cuculus canorus]
MERSAGQRLLAAAWRSLWERGPRPSGCSGVPAIPARLSPCPANRGGMADSRAGSRSQGSRSFSLSATARAVLGMGRWGGDGGKQKLSLRDVAELIRKKECRRVVVMAGAGISTPSGIPDFRSPGSGLYSNLEQYDIPYPEAIFELAYFFSNPKPFFTLAKELYPGNYRPNYAHYFLRLLHEKGLLLRLYTQNIDGLERVAGIPPDKLVEAHGTFATATCTVCRRNFPGEEFRVEPFASLAGAVRSSIPRVLINRDLVGPFAWQQRSNDVAQLGDVISSVEKLVELLGWTAEMETLIQKEKEKLDAKGQ